MEFKSGGGGGRQKRKMCVLQLLFYSFVLSRGSKMVGRSMLGLGGQTMCLGT